MKCLFRTEQSVLYIQVVLLIVSVNTGFKLLVKKLKSKLYSTIHKVIFLMPWFFGLFSIIKQEQDKSSGFKCEYQYENNDKCMFYVYVSIDVLLILPPIHHLLYFHRHILRPTKKKGCISNTVSVVALQYKYDTKEMLCVHSASTDAENRCM